MGRIDCSYNDADSVQRIYNNVPVSIYEKIDMGHYACSRSWIKLYIKKYSGVRMLKASLNANKEK
mgnify:CR=1 FL=1